MFLTHARIFKICTFKDRKKLKMLNLHLNGPCGLKKIPVYAFVMLTAEKFQNVSENAFIVP